MNNIKRIISLMLIIVMVICMFGCTSSKTDNSEEESVSETGTWMINDQNIKVTLPDHVEKAFNKATEGFKGIMLEPLAYVGSQVVAGMNYMILCRATTATQEPVTTYRMAVIYADLEGNAEITSLKDFDLSNYTESKGLSGQEMLPGGWYVPEETSESHIPKEVKDAYEKATATISWKWDKVNILAYLGSQTVAGMNYSVLCKGEITGDDAADNIIIITIYEDLDGNAEISNIHILDLTEFAA